MLGQAGLIGTAVALGLPSAGTSAAEAAGGLISNSKPRLKVIVTGGHPGDPEYGAVERLRFMPTRVMRLSFFTSIKAKGLTTHRLGPGQIVSPKPTKRARY